MAPRAFPLFCSDRGMKRAFGKTLGKFLLDRESSSGYELRLEGEGRGSREFPMENTAVQSQHYSLAFAVEPSRLFTTLYSL